MRRAGTTTHTSTRGVTLLEMLIVVGVLLALFAIALPFTFRMLDERELATTEENITSELMKARVRAQESGKPVEVVVLEGEPSRIAMHYFDMTDRSSSGTEKSRSATERNGGTDRASKQSSGVRSSWWEESQLGPSIRVETLDTSEPAEDALATKSRGERDLRVRNASETPDRARAAAPPLRVAVFLPDGSILFAATLLLMHDNGMSSRMTVDPWTGQTAVARGSTSLTTGGGSTSLTTGNPSPDCPPNAAASADDDTTSRHGETGSTR